MNGTGHGALTALTVRGGAHIGKRTATRHSDEWHSLAHTVSFVVGGILASSRGKRATNAPDLHPGVPLDTQRPSSRHCHYRSVVRTYQNAGLLRQSSLWPASYKSLLPLLVDFIISTSTFKSFILHPQLFTPCLRLQAVLVRTYGPHLFLEPDPLDVVVQCPLLPTSPTTPATATAMYLTWLYASPSKNRLQCLPRSDRVVEGVGAWQRWIIIRNTYAHQVKC